jgi:hypothetical protein
MRFYHLINIPSFCQQIHQIVLDVLSKKIRRFELDIVLPSLTACSNCYFVLPLIYICEVPMAYFFNPGYP